MFKALVLQTQNNLSDERTEFCLRDRLTPPPPLGSGPFRDGSSASCARWMRLLGLGLGEAVPDANTIWTFREALTIGLGPAKRRFAPRRDVSAADRAEKQAIGEGRIPGGWRDKPAKLRRKDRDARWTVKCTKAKPQEDGGKPRVDIAIPLFGHQNHISADRCHRLIRKWRVADAAAHAGARLGEWLDPSNTASAVWADSAYRSKKNEEPPKARLLVSRIPRKKPADRPMPPRIAKANARKSAVRAQVERGFAEQETRMGLLVRTVGLARATTKIGLANLVCNMRRLPWLERQAMPG